VNCFSAEHDEGTEARIGVAWPMNPIGMFENPAMAEQQMLSQLQAEQQQFWYQFKALPLSNDAEREQAIGMLMQRYGQLSVFQADAAFLSNQGYGQLLMAVNQELNAILVTRDQYVNALQAPPYAQMPAQAPQPAPNAPMPPFSGPDDVRAWLARSSAEQETARRRMVGDCIHCGLPTEGSPRCPHCGLYQ
jgi:hypothetical protein